MCYSLEAVPIHVSAGKIIRWMVSFWMCTLWVAPAATAQEQAVTFWYGNRQFFGQHGEPQRWINVLGTVADPARVDTLVYRLNDSPPFGLTMGSDLHRLANPGDFNAEFSWYEVHEGENNLVVEVKYKNGSKASEAVTLVVERNNTWPLPYRVDFTDVDRLQDVVQVIDGHWTLTDEGVRTVTPYYDRVIGVGDTTWHDFEARIRLTVHGFAPSEPGPPTYNVTHFGVAMRWRGHHSDGLQPSRKWFPMGSQGELLLRPLPELSSYRILFGHQRGRQHSITKGTVDFPVALAQERWVRTQVRTLENGDTLYRFKTWPADENEPEAWQAEGTEPGDHDYPSGSLLIVPHNSDVTIHELIATPLD